MLIRLTNKLQRALTKRQFERLEKSSRTNELRTFYTDLGCLYVFPNSSIGSQLIVNDSFESADTLFLRSEIKKSWDIIDIGANIGYYTLLFSKTASMGKVYAIDPVKHHCSILELLKWSNNLDNVRISKIAVSSKNGHTDFCISEDGAFSSFKNTERVGVSSFEKVETITLDTFFEKEAIQKIDLLKIDAEGAEMLIINGAENILSSGKVKRIMLELCPENFSHYNTSIGEVHKKLISYGYESYRVEDGSLVNFDPLNNQFRSINVFYCK